MKVKICNKCGVEKEDPADFMPRTRGGTSTYCRDCDNAANRDWRRRNPEKALRNSRKASLKRNYGLSLEDYEAMVLAQDGVCPVCETKPEVLFVDHCHDSGKVRGLLCQRCNFAIGHMGDDPKRLRNAANYLEGFEK